MTSSIDQDPVVAFLGLGLISGSLAGALKASQWGSEIIAWGPRAPSLERGQALGLIDRFSLDLAQVINEADLIVIGAPPVATAELLPKVLAHAAQGKQPVVTDMASIKGAIVDAAQPFYPRFVPGHPIAGSEHSGVQAANSDLFQGREVILTPVEGTEPTAIATVEALWVAAGARVTRMSVADHDAALAASSHMPHMLAYVLTAMLGSHASDPMKHGGGALRDMTRIAGSDPMMWRDIALTNRDAILEAMDAVSKEHDHLRTLIAERDGAALEALFSDCRGLHREHDGILNPIPKNEESPA